MERGSVAVTLRRYLRPPPTRVIGTDVDSRGDAVITALVPAVELRRYALDLRSLSSTRATFTAEAAGYDERPAHLAVT